MARNPARQKLEDEHATIEVAKTDAGMEIRLTPKPPEERVYEKPPQSERQLSNLEREQEAGRRAVAMHAARVAHIPPRQPDPTEGKMIPVIRPGDRIPALFSPDPANPQGRKSVPMVGFKPDPVPFDTAADIAKTAMDMNELLST